MHVDVTNRHPAAQTVPQPHPPTTDRILPSSWVRHRMGIPCTVYYRTLCRRNRYTHRDGKDAFDVSNVLFSF